MNESDCPTPYAIICREHGRVYLTVEEYHRQMNKPNARWECPRFEADPKDGAGIGFCGRVSEFDDDVYETAMEALATTEKTP